MITAVLALKSFCFAALDDINQDEKECRYMPLYTCTCHIYIIFSMKIINKHYIEGYEVTSYFRVLKTWTISICTGWSVYKPNIWDNDSSSWRVKNRKELANQQQDQMGLANPPNLSHDPSRRRERRKEKDTKREGMKRGKELNFRI